MEHYYIILQLFFNFLYIDLEWLLTITVFQNSFFTIYCCSIVESLLIDSKPIRSFFIVFLGDICGCWKKLYDCPILLEVLKTTLMKVKEESEKAGLKVNIQKTEIMASGPITSWEIDGETVETVSDFILGGSKITADGDCNQEIKRHLLLGRKVMTNLDSILKSRDTTLPTTVCLVKAMVFPVVMYGCESWTVKKAEHWRVYAFEL